MPENVTDALAKFTPAVIDRDAVLFAAGKAAARRWAGWKWLAGISTATNAVTLAVLLWPHPVPPAPPSAPPAELTPPDLLPPDPSSYLAMMRTLDDAPHLASADTGRVDQPRPLRAGDLSRFD